MAAKPSLSRKTIVGIPAHPSPPWPASAFLVEQLRLRPSVIAICDMGARSPHAPTEPFWHITGVTPLLSMSIWVSTTSSGYRNDPNSAC